MSPIKRFLVFALLLPNYGVIKHWGNRTKGKKKKRWQLAFGFFDNSYLIKFGATPTSY